MIKIENTKVVGWEEAIRGMRNPLNSWNKSDSTDAQHLIGYDQNLDNYIHTDDSDENQFLIGQNDKNLAMRLRNAGKDHRKFMRMVVVYADWTAPISWWKEADTYKVGTVRDSCSTMHKITSKPIDINEDITSENLSPSSKYGTKFTFKDGTTVDISPYECMSITVAVVNSLIDMYNSEKDKDSKKLIWRQIIDLLPSSYNQRATMMLNYEVLANMYHSRKNHKMQEWHTLCDWMESLPFSELITG